MSRQKQSQGGQALVEFALIILVLALLALGVVNFGLAVQKSMLMVEAAQEGALYGSFNSYMPTQPASAQTAALKAGTGASGLTAVATYFCTCTPSGPSVTCTSACGSDQPMMYCQVITSVNFNSLFSLASLPTSFTLQNISVMPVE